MELMFLVNLVMKLMVFDGVDSGVDGFLVNKLGLFLVNKLMKLMVFGESDDGVDVSGESGDEVDGF